MLTTMFFAALWWLSMAQDTKKSRKISELQAEVNYYEKVEYYRQKCGSNSPGQEGMLTVELSGAAARHSHFWRDYEAASD